MRCSWLELRNSWGPGRFWWAGAGIDRIDFNDSRLLRSWRFSNEKIVLSFCSCLNPLSADVKIKLNIFHAIDFMQSNVQQILFRIEYSALIDSNQQ